MNVFVTGASGFVGSEILATLHAAGHSLRILARHPNSDSAKRAAAKFNATIVAGDVVQNASLVSAVKGCDAIIHLVGIIGEAGRNTFENVHVNGTRNIVYAAQTAGVPRYLQMSAMGTRPNAVARYHQTKWAAEEMVRGSGLDYTIFRPSIIYGPQDHFVNMFASLSRFSPVMPIIGSGQAKLQPVAVADVARAFVGALTEPKSINQTYDLGGVDVLSFGQVIDAILEVLGRRRMRLHIPLGLAKLQASMLEVSFGKLLHKVPPLSRDQILMLQEDNVGDSTSAKELFHLSSVGFKSGIASYLKRQ